MRQFTKYPTTTRNIKASQDVLLSSPMFDLVAISGVGRNNIPWSGMEVVSKGLAKKWVVEIRLDTRRFPNFDDEGLREKGVVFEYGGCYVNYGLRGRIDTHIEEFIEVLQAAKEFKDKLDNTYNWKTHF